MKSDLTDIVSLEDAGFLETETTVQRSLSSELEQETVGAFLVDDLGHEIDRDRDEVDLGNTVSARKMKEPSPLTLSAMPCDV